MGAFNGTGTFVRSYSWVVDKANGVNITASRQDTEDNGFSAGLTLCTTRDGQGMMAAHWQPSVTATYDLGVSGSAWRNLNITGNASIGGTLAATGNATLSGTLAVTGATTLTGGLSGDTAGRGVALCKFTNATETRTSTTTLTNSSSLALTLGAGTYAVSAYILLNQAAAAGGGLAFNLNFSGTMTAGASQFINVQSVSGAVVEQSQAISATVNNLVYGTASFGQTFTFNAILTGVLTATGSGTFAFAFAQNVSNGNATQLLPGSYLTVTQLS